MKRCGECKNCQDLERIKKRVLAAVNPPFSHGDDDVVILWNRELERLPCLKQDPPVQLAGSGNTYTPAYHKGRMEALRRIKGITTGERSPDEWKALLSVFSTITSALELKVKRYSNRNFKVVE